MYFATALGLTVALDVVPELATVAPAIFPVLSLCGVGILAIRADYTIYLLASGTRALTANWDAGGAADHRLPGQRVYFSTLIGRRHTLAHLLSIQAACRNFAKLLDGHIRAPIERETEARVKARTREDGAQDQSEPASG